MSSIETIDNFTYSDSSIHNNWCIHIQTYIGHFKYIEKLVNSILTKDTSDNPIKIFVTVDNYSEFEKILQLKTFQEKNPRVFILNYEEILPKIKCDLGPDVYSDLLKNKKNVLPEAWAATAWGPVKRAYTILYLKQNGFDYIWALDSEGEFVKDVNVNNIFMQYINEPYLLISDKQLQEKKWTAKHQIILSLFDDKNIDKNIKEKVIKCAVRQNDFFFYKTIWFENFIKGYYSQK